MMSGRLGRAAASLMLGAVVLSTACSTLVRTQGRQHERKLQRAGLTHAIMELPSGSLEVWSGGEGPPLLLLHGFGASAPWQWSRQVGPLARGRRLVVPNLAGFGQSYSSESDRGLDMQADLLAQLCTALGIDKASIVGVSYGGMVGYRLATRHPEHVERLVLVDSPGGVAGAQAQAQLLARHQAASTRELLLPQDEAGIARLLALAYVRPPPTTKALRRAVLQQLYTTRRDDQAQLLAALDAAAMGAEGRLPTQSVSMIWGEGDTVFSVDLARAVSERLDAPLQLIPRTAHAPNLERPRAFNAALQRALR